MSGAEILMDRPPGGWSDLVTNHTLDLRFAAFEERSDRKLEALEARMELRFADVDRRFDALEARFDARFRAVDDRFVMVGHLVDRLDDRIDGLGDRMDGLDERMARLEAELRAQTWKLMTLMVAVVGVVVAAVRL